MRPALARASCVLALATAATTSALAQTAAPAVAPPPYATTRVADNVYVFRMLGHQSMFVVTPDGVIATDPIGFVDKKGARCSWPRSARSRAPR